MDYIGSKEKLNPWMFSKIEKYKKKVFLDACAGSCSVSRFAASRGFKVVANDLMAFPSYLAYGSINVSDKNIKLIDACLNEIDSLKGSPGFFFQNYSVSAGRPYFTDRNAQLIDACRIFIETVDDEKIKSHLIYCLLEAVSRVSNTTGTYGAFLKEIKPRAKSKLKLRKEKFVKDGEVFVYNRDILDLLSDEEFKQKFPDHILYIDPPYNSRQYAPNYHLYETLVKYDSPQIKGKTGIRADWQKEAKSKFCMASEANKFFSAIVTNSISEVIFISYNSDGLLSIDALMDTIFETGKVLEIVVHTIEQRRYKADSSEEREYNTSLLKEYLLEVICDEPYNRVLF